MAERPPFPPALGLAVAVVSVSFAAPLFRLTEAPALTASFWRLAFAVLLLLPLARPAWPTWRSWGAGEWGLVVLSGVALGLHFALWVSSLFLTTVAASVTLVTLQAVFVALGGHLLLGEPLSRSGWSGVLVATAGALVIGGSGLLAEGPGMGGAAMLGNLLAVLGGVAAAAYMIIGRRVRRRHGLVSYVTPVYAVAAATVLLALPLTGQPVAAGVEPRAFVLFVLLAAVPMLGGHTMANWCLRHIQAHVVATWILLEPVGAALLAWWLLGEVPPPMAAGGAVLVLVGAAWTIRPQARRPSRLPLQA